MRSRPRRAARIATGIGRGRGRPGSQRSSWYPSPDAKHVSFWVEFLLVSAALREVFNAEHRAHARERLTHVLARLGARRAEGLPAARGGRGHPIAFYAFPREHWTKLRSTNPLERVHKEIGRRSDVVGIFPNDASVIRCAGALLSGQNDEWLVQRRYLSAESMTLILAAAANEENSLEQQPDKEIATLNAA